MSQLKLTADSGGGTVAIKGPASTTGNAALDLVVPGTASATLDTLKRAGNILQVLSVRKTDAFTTTSTSFVDVTGLTLSITPSSASNKIFVFYSAYLSSSGADYGSVSKLVRDSTDLEFGYNQTNPVQSGTGGTTVNQLLDTPNTTSSVTYKIQLKSHSTSHNARIGAGGNGGTDVPESVITLMEVAG